MHPGLPALVHTSCPAPGLSSQNLQNILSPGTKCLLRETHPSPRRWSQPALPFLPRNLSHMRGARLPEQRCWIRRSRWCLRERGDGEHCPRGRNRGLSVLSSLGIYWAKRGLDLWASGWGRFLVDGGMRWVSGLRGRSAFLFPLSFQM